MPVDRKDVDYVAGLARLRLSETERVEITKQLGRILDYVEQLRQLDVDDVPPTKHVIEVTDVYREDEPLPGLDRDRVLENAPDVADGHFVVPRAIPDRG